MTILDENSSFGEWAEVWAERKVIGRSYKYVTSTYNFVHHLENISTIPINKVRSMNIEGKTFEEYQTDSNRHFYICDKQL